MSVEYSEVLAHPELNYMTERTRQRLIQEAEKLDSRAKEEQGGLAATQDNAADWHDNFAYDELTRQVQMMFGRVDAMRTKLRDVVIIKPRERTDVIDVGNTVVVLYEGEKETEAFTLLGPDDTHTEQDWISFQSPLGMQLVGRRVGESIALKNGMRVQIQQVLPGEF